MTSRRGLVPAAVCAALLAGAAVAVAVQTQARARVYELRTYTVPADRLDALHARFRDHTMRIFQRHGMNNVVYFRPQDPERATTTMVYLISHASRQAADASWAAFRKDPEWQTVAAASGVGPVKVESQFLDPTDYSPMK